MSTKGTTTPIHADDSSKGTTFDFSQSNGYKKYFDENGVKSVEKKSFGDL